MGKEEGEEEEGGVEAVPDTHRGWTGMRPPLVVLWTAS